MLDIVVRGLERMKNGDAKSLKVRTNKGTCYVITIKDNMFTITDEKTGKVAQDVFDNMFTLAYRSAGDVRVFFTRLIAFKGLKIVHIEEQVILHVINE